MYWSRSVGRLVARIVLPLVVAVNAHFYVCFFCSVSVVSFQLVYILHTSERFFYCCSFGFLYVSNLFYTVSDDESKRLHKRGISISIKTLCVWMSLLLDFPAFSLVLPIMLLRESSMLENFSIKESKLQTNSSSLNFQSTFSSIWLIWEDSEENYTGRSGVERDRFASPASHDRFLTGHRVFLCRSSLLLLLSCVFWCVYDFSWRILPETLLSHSLPTIPQLSSWYCVIICMPYGSNLGERKRRGRHEHPLFFNIRLFFIAHFFHLPSSALPSHHAAHNFSENSGK